METSEFLVSGGRLSVVSAGCLTRSVVICTDGSSAMGLSRVDFVSEWIVASLDRQHPLPQGVAVTQYVMFMKIRANTFHRLLAVINLFFF